MAIGYACLTVGIMNTNLRSCILKNATFEKLYELTQHNLASLDRILDYNIKNNINLFRISSDLIPFASIPGSTFNWQELFSAELINLGKKAMKNGIRLTMHPGQYTVLNSPNEDVVERAILDLNYHSELLDAMGLSSESKVVLHIGGSYQSKTESIQRFIENFQRLDNFVKQRIVLENDDKIYNISDVLEIATILNVPVIYDNLHNFLNASDPHKSDMFWITECKRTWKKTDGKQKVHYSQQDPNKKAGSHSSTIKISEFLEYYNSINFHDLDIMLEVKDKNLSAIKCINCTSQDKKIKYLEEEWSKYKYSVLEKSPQNYHKIRTLLKSKQEYPAIPFYTLLEDALSTEIDCGKALNGILHVWGYFKKLATEKEKSTFMRLLQNLEENNTSIEKIKKYLYRLSLKYNTPFLLQSYYFDI